MIKLRKILLSNIPYLVLLFLTIIISTIRLALPKTSIYTKYTKKIEGIITQMDIDGAKLKLQIKSKEEVIATYYFKTKKEKEKISSVLNLGDKIMIEGKFNEVKQNKTQLLFDYQSYLKRKNIYCLVSIEKITLKEKNKQPLFQIKNFLIKRSSNRYVKIFILGDTSSLDDEIRSNYREIGISHLFAISGMHITLLSTIFLKILSLMHIKEEKRYLIVALLLILYLLIVNNSPSIIRAVLFFILFSVNKIKYLYIKGVNLFITTMSISLLYNPSSLFDVSFQYSYIISFSLIVLSSFINQFKTYFSKLLITSLICFIVSLPITLYHFNQINILSIIYNLFYIPLISIVIFPLSLIVLMIPKLEPLLNFFVLILEMTSTYLSQITISKWIFQNISLIYYFLYYLLIVLFFLGLIDKKYLYLFPFFVFILIHYLIPYMTKEDYLLMIDVGQGDSILIHSKNKNVLIDTGGIMTYHKKKWQKQRKQYSIVKNTTLPLLKKYGIKKIDYLILTHGDYDHLGEAITLINNYKVKQIFINSNEINSLEEKIIKTFPKVSMVRQGDSFTAGNADFLQLNKNLEDENDSSLVYLVLINHIKVLLMGDASMKSEEEVMKKYNLENIDILKAGHHGSKTSSGENFIKKTNPKLVLISAGLDNKFNHPNQEVIKRYNKYNIFYLITFKEGSIKIPLN